jgi:ectoine hydroxylase-related dioxygenase (phytanoyl-CoA dioxygenase family)
MSEIISEKKIAQFKKDGYIHLKKFFNKQEIDTFLKAIKKKSFIIESENIDRTVDIEEFWDFICHKKMLESIRLLIGNKINYLHTASMMSNSINLERNPNTWHRDNPCRRTGDGPDWNTKEAYNVVSSIVYLTDTDSTLNVIKKSHFKKYKYSISNILRTIDLNLRKFRSLIFIKKIIKKIIGKDLKYESGDLIIFYTTLYHARSDQKNMQDSYRSAAIARYGDVSIHSKTYLNYEMNYRQGLEKYKVSKKKRYFFSKA